MACGSPSAAAATATATATARLARIEEHLEHWSPSTFILSEQVSSARRSGRAIVALESTIICHGLPYPSNLQAAREMEEAVRREGAVPATIAILRGVVHVGLSDEQLVALAKKGSEAIKVSRRDLAYCLSQKLNGATTVSGTMVLAHLAGIRVFATGGIGGVHKGGQSSMDISADLTELGRTPVAVVCAGIKSILDIPRTLEVLETQGVAVVTLGQKEFPAFFTRHSGVDSPLVCQSHTDIARLISATMELNLSSGVVVAVPPPIIPNGVRDEHEVMAASDQATREAADSNIKGREVTPFVLRRVAEITRGRSVATNIALVKNNARSAAQIAVLMESKTPRR